MRISICLLSQQCGDTGYAHVGLFKCGETHKDQISTMACLPPERLLLEESGTTLWIIDWDCPQLQTQVQWTINFLMKGCSCKKGWCEGKRCGCWKKGNTCGPGCQCQGCTNLPAANERVAQNQDNGIDTSNCESWTYEYESEDEQTGVQVELVTEDLTIYYIVQQYSSVVGPRRYM